MADLSDVLNTVVSTVASVLYPNGMGAPSSIGNPCRIYAGWPVTGQIDDDLKSGIVNVSVFAPPGMEQNTTRYPRDWNTLTQPSVTLTATVDGTGTQVTIGGTISTPQNVALIVNGKAYVYAVQATDTTATIATAVAALVNADTPASSAGAVVSIPGAKHLVARVGGVGTSIREIRRQNRQVQITFWCPSPAVRDAAASRVDAALAAIEFVSLPDGSAARWIYQKTLYDDSPEKAFLWRRDLFYSAEYATTQTETDAQITVMGPISITGGPDFSTQFPIATLNE